MGDKSPNPVEPRKISTAGRPRPFQSDSACVEDRIGGARVPAPPQSRTEACHALPELSAVAPSHERLPPPHPTPIPPLEWAYKRREAGQERLDPPFPFLTHTCIHPSLMGDRGWWLRLAVTIGTPRC
ncbi:hypothetical protein CDAR_526831 [Caerostris darwini]|uniref:Uncharacterized protein n=1 Tax=Caerostris darwini TaxID=1538125 RepID=A0AAV4Q172_9ARAC|nr:hypothetical protein CDAR_526831 [Caerostris darwini]